MNARKTNSAGIKPLTKTTVKGELYVRRTDSERQIVKVLTLLKPQILPLLTGNKRRDEADYLLDETLVYLFREARISGDEELFNQTYVELNRRIWKLFLKFRSNFKEQADFEDFGQKIEAAILKKLLNTDSNAADFAQVQFGLFVIAEAKAAWKRNLVKIVRDGEFYDTKRFEDEEKSGGELENLGLKSDSTPEKTVIFREMMHELTPDERTIAAMLGDGFQIESRDENELTISRHLNVSSRTIRTIVKEMRAKLAEYRGEISK